MSVHFMKWFRQFHFDVNTVVSIWKSISASQDATFRWCENSATNAIKHVLFWRSMIVQLSQRMRTNAQYVELGRVRADKRASKPVWSDQHRQRNSKRQPIQIRHTTTCFIFVLAVCYVRWYCGSAALQRIINPRHMLGQLVLN